MTLCACEPTSVTEARDQLRRGAEHVTRLSIPIAQDTLAIGDFLSSDTTSVNGLVGLAFDPDSVNVNVGTQLQFNNLTLAQFTAADIPGAAPIWAAGGTFSFGPTQYNALSTEPRIAALDSIVAQSGSLTITTSNKLQGTLTYTVTLNGFKNGAGQTLTQTSTVGAGNGVGGATSSQVVFNLAGVTITPATASATISGSVTIPPGSNPATGTAPVAQNGTGSLVVQVLKGNLNPVTTPELAVTVENGQELPGNSIDFGDFKDAVSSATLNNASATLTLVNSANTPVVLSNFKLGAVQVNGSGQLIRDGLGNLVYEKDGSNNPILVTVADPSQATLTLARTQTKSVTISAPALVDRVAHLLINNTRVALVAAGTATAGDGASSRIVRTDFIKVRFGLTVGLDITVPVSGVLFTRTEVTDGLKQNDADATDLAGRVQQAVATAKVANGTPFGVVVQIVLAPDSIAPNVDIFSLPGRITLDSVVMKAPTVDVNGLVTAPTSDSVTVSISGANSKALFGRKFSVGARIRLLPGTGGNGRGALRTTDRLIVNARAEVDVKSGGGS